MVLRLDETQADFEAVFQMLLNARREISADIDSVARDIMEDVQENGDEALYRYTLQFDKTDIKETGLAFSDVEISQAISSCSKEERGALALAAERITSYHERQRPADEHYHDALGVKFGVRWTSLESVGLYVPGGTANYPSSVLMNAIPARVAGVDRIIMVVPTPQGTINPLVLAAAHLAGVHEIYRIGGAQAVAALAYGTQTIAPVVKIIGPGNAFVAAAKRRVFGTVGIDMIAGPSEVLIVADRYNSPDWIAIDLLAQAEHDPAAQSILMTDDYRFADQVSEAVQRLLNTLPRQDVARASWETHGAIITVKNLQRSVPLIDKIAPEHLEISIQNADKMAEQIRNAGAIFIGAHTPEAIGDYVGGSNHVLPTARSARFSSGLSVLDFVKRTSVLKCGPDQLRALGPTAVTLAHAEGLDAHAKSVTIRLN